MGTEKDIRLRQRIDTAANWQNKGKLLNKEIGIDSTNRIIKRGTSDNQTWENATTLYSPGDEWIEWGGKNIQNDNYGAFDATLIKEMGVANNQWAFFPSDYITIEYSIDGGETWVDKECSSAIKTNLVSCPTASSGTANITIGDMIKGSSERYSTTNDLLRIILNCDGRSYFKLKKIALRCTECPTTRGWVMVEGAMKNKDFVTLKSKTTISGWPGWNILNDFDNVLLGGYTTQNFANMYKQIRITIGLNQDTSADNISSGYYGAFSITKLVAYGIYQNIAPSQLATSGHLYSYDYNQNAYFPNAIQASSFKGNATSASKLSYSAKFCTEGLSYKGYHQILQMQTIGANAVGSIMFHITGAETEAYYDNTYAINITGNASNIYIQSAKQISGEKLEKPLLYYKSGNTVYIHAWRGQWQDLYVTDITQNVNSACIVTWTKTDVFSTTDAILSEDYKEFEYLPAYPSDAVTTHIIGATENENVDGSYNDDLVGSNILYARADHTHLMPLAIDGIQNISNNGLMCVSAQSELNLSGSLLTIGNTTLNINSNQAYYKDKEIAVKDDIIYPKIVVETIPEQKDYTNGLKRIDFKTTRKINVDLCNGENDGYNILKLEIDGFYPIYIDISTAHTTHYLRKIGDDQGLDWGYIYSYADRWITEEDGYSYSTWSWYWCSSSDATYNVTFPKRGKAVFSFMQGKLEGDYCND